MYNIYQPVAPVNSYTANGLTTIFPFNFYVIYDKDLSVYINSTLVTSGYTVSGIGSEDGGEVTFLTPPASGSTVYIARIVELYRIVEYADNGDLLSDTVNSDFDRIWMVLTQEWWQFQYCMRRDYWGDPWEGQGFRIQNVADPINDQDVVTKKYAEEHYTQNNWRADWNASTAYYSHDGVHYAGSSWYCENNNTNIPPGSDTHYWTMMAQKGDKGDKGDTGGKGSPGNNWRENWNSTTQYYMYDGVFYAGSSWYCEKDNKGITPGTNTAYWSMMAQKGDDGIDGTSPDMSNYYTKTDIQNNYYNKSEIDAMISGGGSSTTYGAVGSYVFGGRHVSGNAGWNPGDTVSGSGLIPAGVASMTQTGTTISLEFATSGFYTPLSGTWRAMGFAIGVSSDFNKSAVSLFVRIA